jgi:DNA repair protein RecN (Recombination protein N)
VRSGAERALVEGRFLLQVGDERSYGASVLRWLEAELPEALELVEADSAELAESAESAESDRQEFELILSRSLGRDGRTRAHLNHRPVTQRVLRELATRLVEIHGQNDHQRLFDAGEQLRLVDEFGGFEDALAGYAERRALWLELENRRQGFEANEKTRAERLELLRHQVRELAEARGLFEEREALGRERELLRHADALGRELGLLVDQLSECENPLVGELSRAAETLESWAERVSDLSEAASSLREAAVWAEEAAGRVRSFVDGVEASPGRLDEVEEALAEIARLERKYDLPAEELAPRLEAMEGEIAELESAELGREELDGRTRQALASLAESASRLGRDRRALRKRLEKAVGGGLTELGLARARFEVVFEARETSTFDLEEPPAVSRKRFGETGSEAVELRLAANPGEPLRPLREVASGGEAARIMLALRGALAVRHSTPTLIFDEVDAGVGGRLGPKVGAHLRALADSHQVLCVTHLPAIAALGHRHLRVSKVVRGKRTRTHVQILQGEEREQEVADMIAGGADQDTARAEARRLLSEALARPSHEE